jgi:peptidoglycan/xylan/chitin deacetylase (PgdA/CDA1 family)
MTRTHILTSAPAAACSVRRGAAEFVVGVMLGANSGGSFDHLLAAVSTLDQNGQPVRLVLFGARETLELGSLSAIENLQQDVAWVPDDGNTRASLEGCDVLVSLQDGAPLLVLRAACMRIPILTTAIRVPEVLRNQRTVLFIRHVGQHSLETALLRLSTQPKRRAIPGIMSEEITRYYSDSYLWRENGSATAPGHAPTSRALMKRALFGAVPARQLLEHGDPRRPQIALTIDDGPDPVYTPRILDIFKDHEVKATFFVVGGAAEQYPDIVLRMKKEGHDVGNHSYSHPYFHRLSWSGAMQEIGMTRSVLNRILGEECKLFRPPHGKLSLRTLLPAWASGQQVVMWNVDLKDYCASVGEVEAKLDRTSFSSGDIVLYHGVKEAALRALPKVISAARENGRKAVTISTLARP